MFVDWLHLGGGGAFETWYLQRRQNGWGRHRNVELSTHQEDTSGKANYLCFYCVQVSILVTRSVSSAAELPRALSASSSRWVGFFRSLFARLRRQQREREPVSGSGEYIEIQRFTSLLQTCKLYFWRTSSTWESFTIYHRQTAVFYERVHSYSPTVFREESVAFGAKTRDEDTLQISLRHG